MNDSFYTPDKLATTLLSASRVENPSHVADFAVGAGSLLSAARRKWPHAQLYGVDICSGALHETQKSLPGARTFEGDFLSNDVLESLREVHGKIDLIVLNPPFSCRGATFTRVDFEGSDIKASKAMAFILKGCSFLSENGELLAILPRSCLQSEKDSKARYALLNKYQIEDLGVYERPGFKRANVSINLVRITKRTGINSALNQFPSAPLRITRARGYDVEIMRGSHPVGEAVIGGSGYNLIHTTELIRSQISSSQKTVSRTAKAVSGTVIMLPRVGRPDAAKVSIGTFVTPVVPSDCVICIKSHPSGHEEHLRSQIVRFWDSLMLHYSGTCASYLTMNNLKRFLQSIGYTVNNSKEHSSWNPLCTHHESIHRAAEASQRP